MRERENLSKRDVLRVQEPGGAGRSREEPGGARRSQNEQKRARSKLYFGSEPF